MTKKNILRAFGEKERCSRIGHLVHHKGALSDYFTIILPSRCIAFVSQVIKRLLQFGIQYSSLWMSGGLHIYIYIELGCKERFSYFNKKKG